MWSITEWLEQREADRRTRKYREGFAWAMTAFYLEKESCQSLHVHTCYANHPFDEGAQKALRIIQRNEESCRIDHQYPI